MTNMHITGTPLAFAFVLGMAAAASAQVYPSRPVTLIVPFPAGGGVDAMARITAERLTPRLDSRSLSIIAAARPA